MIKMRWLVAHTFLSVFLMLGGCSSAPHYRVVELKPLPGFHFSDANDIDDRGVAYGYCEEGDATRNTIWRGGVPYESNKQPAKPGRRDVVGARPLGGKPGVYHAIVRTGGKVYDLNGCIDRDNEWQLWSARAMDRNGEIVGAGLFQGRNRGFLLIPSHKKSPATAKSKQAHHRH